MGIFSKPAPRTLRNEALDMLRRAIITGQLIPGQHLKEIELSEQMEISRSPVREALRTLEEEGLVESVPNQGCFVKSYGPQQIVEIFTLRTALENLAGELVIQQDALDGADFEALNDLVVRQDQAAQARDLHTLTGLDMDFHEYLCRKSGSELLLKTWRGLRNQIQVLFYQRFQVQERIFVSETMQEDHHLILKALREKDLPALTALNKAINARVVDECIASFR
jgi:DNA-binding GntR family transcriptional regulator